jgi:general stress protein YciG
LSDAEENIMAHSRRGFASMDREKQRQIASKGGRAAHAKGTAHEFTHQEAVEAGRKGGRAAQARNHGERSQTDESAVSAPQQAPSADTWQEEQPEGKMPERPQGGMPERYIPPMGFEHGPAVAAQT